MRTTHNHTISPGVLCALLTALALPAPSSAASLSVRGSSSAGQHIAVKIVAPDRATYCLLSARTRAGTRRQVPIQVAGLHLRVSWRIPTAVKAGTYHLAARCGASRAQAHHDDPATATVRIRGGRHGAGRNLIDVRSLRTATGGAGRGAARNPFAVPSGILWCTWWAYERRPDIYDTAVANGGPRWDWDAYVWADRAVRFARMPIGKTAVVGAIAVYSREYYGYPARRDVSARYGHVAYVESVDAGGYTVSQHGGDRAREPFIRHHPNGEPNVVFIYGGTAGNGPSSQPTPQPASQPKPTPQPAPQPSAPTYSETTGGITRTWTNYTNAGGAQGPSITSNQTVQIACKLHGFRVANGNTWWYRIASSPWSNSYYASADAFYNNGQTSGPLRGTPFMDSNVRDC